jgi:hypothetical protein
MHGAIPPFTQYVFMAWCLVKHRDNFTSTFMRNTLLGLDVGGGQPVLDGRILTLSFCIIPTAKYSGHLDLLSKVK